MVFLRPHFSAMGNVHRAPKKQPAWDCQYMEEKVGGWGEGGYLKGGYNVSLDGVALCLFDEV